MATWTKIEDIRDDASVNGPTWELVEDSDDVIDAFDVERDELPMAPDESDGRVWRSGRRWLCR